MKVELNQIDPQWAWSTFTPRPGRPWNRALAAHLYRRAGFCATSHELDEAVASEPADIVRRMAVGGRESQRFRQEFDALAETILATGDPRQLSAVWVYRLLNTPDTLLEKATLFWHGHFATSAEKVQDARMMLDQNNLLRRHALGDFAQMVQDISKNPAMLIYLDSATNRKAHPNENYARELMELFCLGEGNYTEKDIQELARCFTGWEVRRGKFRFNRYQHDFGEKTVLGATDKFGGQDGVRIVLDQPSMPRFIVTKLIRYFVLDEPEPSAELVEPLADQFRGNGLQIGPVIERILSSELFFSKHAVARKVRSPIELAIGLLRALEGSTNSVFLASELTQLGHGLFYPPNVKGWDGGRTWINSSTLLGRANLVRGLLKSEKTRFAGASLAELVQQRGLDKPGVIVQWLLDLLFAAPPTESARKRLVALYEETKGDQDVKLRELIHAMSTLPEFQLA